jgi:Uma2 family endonuclease
MPMSRIPRPRPASPDVEIDYPESDGKPMADNTIQFRWIQRLEGNLEALFRDREDVFVAGDNLWYPVKGDIKTRQAPDVYVVFGRPKGDRGAYVQHREEGVPLTVVFEVLSPKNTVKMMEKKLDFYDTYGVEEYYVYDPKKNALTVYKRGRPALRELGPKQKYTSPRLGIKFDLAGDEMVVYYPDGKPFLTFEEMEADRERERQGRVHAEEQARLATEQANANQQKADQALQQAARLAELGRKARKGEATPAELSELESLETQMAG